jgi:CBS domain-containing protein
LEVATMKVKSVMHTDPVTVPVEATAAEAARLMKNYDIGDVIVVQDGECCGIVTDRDLVIRVVAEGRDPTTTQVGEICSAELITISPDDDVETATAWMRERALRRLPITQDGRVVGIVSLGDLALERDPASVLADISAAPPNT